MSEESRRTFSLTIHPWCLDPARDEAVRAAEDGRPGPLPTLEECIWMLAKSGSGSSGQEHKNKGDDMATKAEIQQAEYRAEAAERVKIKLPPTPEPSVARVTLEFSGRLLAPPSAWPWDLILSGACVVSREPGESVRVVDGDITDGEIRLRDQRDAAIRERDAAKSDAEKSAVLIKSQAENVAYFRRDRDETRLRAEAAEARVAELESERDAAIRERDEFRRSFHWSEEAGTRLVAERDASRDDADGLRILVAELEAERDGLQVDVSALMDVGHRLGSQVASLEEQLESVADRAAAAETALEAAPAASGAAVTEPVAWGVTMPGHETYGECSVWSVRRSEELARRAFDAADGWIHFPLYAAPQPASGWLTEEERDFLDHHRRECEERASTFSEARAVPWCRRLKMIDALLARSTPPEVVRPQVNCAAAPTYLEIVRSRDGQWIAALVAAGVTVEAKQ